MMRAVNPSAALRLGVFGNLSAISSMTASAVKVYAVIGKAMNASGVRSRCIQPKRAAQLRTAGAVSDRSPAITPIRNARGSGDTTQRFYIRWASTMWKTGSVNLVIQPHFVSAGLTVRHAVDPIE